MGNNSKALEFYDKALKIREKTVPPNHPDLAQSYKNIGGVYDNMGNYWKALEFYDKALKIYEKLCLRIIPYWLLPTTTSVWLIP
ncbi:unnamed protein product, partial [Rotaria sp. Silwood1]